MMKLLKGLQKLMSQSLELLDEKLLQEDVNKKLLRSLSPEWNTHAVVWRNKADLETMSMGDLYNNLKVYEPEVKGMSSSSIKHTEHTGFLSDTTATRGTFLLRSAELLRNQDTNNKESSRKDLHVATFTFTALLSCDRLGGYDWSESGRGWPNYALMLSSSSSLTQSIQ
ncbi:hypothetical protein Tco_0278709 [Tanacetum coccineum]